MNKYKININIAIIISLFIWLNTTPAVAQVCPSGLVNDPAPGQCGLYTDNDNNNFCDLSEPSSQPIPNVVAPITPSTNDLKDLITGKDLKTKTVSEAADLFGVDEALLAEKISQTIGKKVKTTDSFQLLHDNYGLSPDAAKDLIVALKTGATAPTTEEVTESTKDYLMWQITLGSLAVYLLSLFLVRQKYLSVVQNRRFWNGLLLIAFIITALTSILVLLRLNYNITISFPLNIVFWHIEIGYAMILIAIFHALWHIPYFKSYFKKR